MRNKGYFFLVLLYFINLPLQAQLKEYALDLSDNKLINARTQSSHLNLPFWEDFFDSPFNVLSDSLWSVSTSPHVLVNDHFAYLPPSAGVVTFDGLRNDGSPYSTDNESRGPTDRLESNLIDLSSYSSADNIYLSFFYQHGGLSEAPDLDDNDRLVVEFLDADGETWVNVQEILPPDDIDPEEFYQILIPITASRFLHGDFQFAIQSYGRQNGPVDVWNLDYFYINEGRSPTDIYYPDRTIVNSSSKIFDDYTSIPRTHVNYDVDFSAPEFPIQTLYNTFQNWLKKATVTIYTTENTFVVDFPYTSQRFQDGYSTGTPIQANEFDTLVMDFDFSSSIPEVDSNVLRISYYTELLSFDNNPGDDDSTAGNYMPIYEPIDFRINNSFTQDFILSDYYAYDDGTAESSAALEVAQDMMSYLFELRNVDSAFLYGFDMNTIFSRDSSLGNNFNFHIWEDDGGIPGTEIFRQRFTVKGNQSYNEFSRYNFYRPVEVDSKFHIGVSLISDGFLAIGLDKNNNSIDKVHENANGFWESPANRYRGAVMLRPYVGPPPDGPITSVEDITKNINVYPNPTFDGNVFIEGDIRSVVAYDLMGKTVNAADIRINSGRSSIYFDNRGMYILRILTEDGLYVQRKVLVK